MEAPLHSIEWTCMYPLYSHSKGHAWRYSAPVYIESPVCSFCRAILLNLHRELFIINQVCVYWNSYVAVSMVL